MKNILLINMSSYEDGHASFKDYNPALGIMSIATVLELHGYSCTVIDYCYEVMDMDKLLQTINEKNISIVGISVYTINVDDALQYAKFLKKSLEHINIILGGPHASLDVKYCLGSRYIDYIIRGEGEFAFLELIEAIYSDFKLVKPKDINGVCFTRKREHYLNNFRETIRDLDLLPLVKRQLVNINKYQNTVNVSSSRGCPACCVYCAGSVLGGKSYRVRSIDNVILEIAYLKNILGDKLRLIYFIDDTFTVFKKRVLKYLKLRKKFAINCFWRCESRVDVMDTETIDAISENGCLAIHFGVESGSQEVLNKIQKKIILVKAIKLIKYAASKDMLVCCYFMLGHYCDTLETMEKTCDLIKELVENFKVDATLHYNTPYPGTFQYEHRDSLGINLSSTRFCDFVGYKPIIETKSFTVKDQERIYNSVRGYLNCSNFSV